MTNKRTGNSKSNRKSLRDDKQKGQATTGTVFLRT
jgi:hypothetical protein